MPDEEIYEESTEEITEAAGPIYRDYKMDFLNKRIAGKVEDKDAAVQYAMKTFRTKRFAHQIYDNQYGCDIFNKVGKKGLTDSFFDSDIPKMIAEALVPNESILGIEDVVFEMGSERDSVLLSFTMLTIFGDIDMKEVVYNERL